MSFSSSQITTICLSAFLVIGIGFVLFGLLVIPAIPYVQLDVVLSREELADEATKNATLAMLQRAQGNEWIFWSFAGLLIVALSAVGLYANHCAKYTPDKSS